MFSDPSQKKVFLLFAVLISATLVLALIYPHFRGSDAEDMNNAFKRELIRDGKRSFSSFQGISIKENNEDGTGIQIKAVKADIRNRKMGFFRVAVGKVTEMKDVSIVLTENNMDIVSISSGLATMYMGLNNILFEKSVVCSLASGEVLKTEKLLWDKKNELFSTEGLYEYTNKVGSLKSGKGFKADKKFETIKFMDEYKRLAKRGAE